MDLHHEEAEPASIGSVEDGEIADEQAEQVFIPIAGRKSAARTDEDDDFDGDDEAPEEILNKYAQQRAAKMMPEEELDPNLCRVCRDKPHKYRCPKCDCRSCSLTCIKRHKEEHNCDGIRPPFAPVTRMSQFDEQTSVKDQQWMATVQGKVYDGCPITMPQETSSGGREGQTKTERGAEQMNQDFTDKGAGSRDEDPSEGGRATAEQGGPPRQFPQYINEDGTRNSANNAVERFLLPNANRRRIFLSFSSDKGGEDGSRHEQFSDSIFWCIDIIFRKQQSDGSCSDYTYRIQNIPETIRICTILKQFLKPRQYGCIVSQSDLDMEKMAPFCQAAPEALIHLMRVPRLEKERYYVVNPEKTMLDNTRNRVVVDHPKIIVMLGSECLNVATISEEEAEDLRSRLQKERSAQMHKEGGGGRGGRGGRGGFRGGFRGGQRDFHGGAPRDPTGPPRDSSQGFLSKRGFQNGPPSDSWKTRGRGGGFRGRGGPRGGGRGYRQNELDCFDPFEPFSGKHRLPSDYGMQRTEDEGYGVKRVKKTDPMALLDWDSLTTQSVPHPSSPPSTKSGYVAPDVSSFKY